MSDQSQIIFSGLFSVVHVETLEGGEIDCLSVLVHDGSDGKLKAFYEARIQHGAIDGSGPETVSLYNAMHGLNQTCHETTLVAYEVEKVRRFIDEACRLSGADNPFTSGNDVDVKTLVRGHLNQVGSGAVGLRDAAHRLGIRGLPNSDSPSWGAVAVWYVLRRLVKI